MVDDNQDSAESLTVLLNLTGNETRTAYDGLQAAEAAARFRPDIILLDLGLPKMNGYEAARKIREQPWGKKMPITVGDRPVRGRADGRVGLKGSAEGQSALYFGRYSCSD